MKIIILSLVLLAGCSSTKDDLCPPDDLDCPKTRYKGDEQVRIENNPALDSKMMQNTPSGQTSDMRTDIPTNEHPIPPSDQEMK